MSKNPVVDEEARERALDVLALYMPQKPDRILGEALDRVIDALGYTPEPQCRCQQPPTCAVDPDSAPASPTAVELDATWVQQAAEVIERMRPNLQIHDRVTFQRGTGKATLYYTGLGKMMLRIDGRK